jgi:hypothetical protein
MLDKHPIFIALSAERRRELLANKQFATLGETAQCTLLDGVKQLREELDYRDQSDRFNDPHRRDKNADVLARSLAAVLKIIDPQRPGEISRIRADLIIDLSDFSDLNRDTISDAIRELEAFCATARRIEEAISRIQRIQRAPDDDLQHRTRRSRREASGLYVLLTTCGVKVSKSDKDPGLALMGLLADPPISRSAMRKHLRL